MSLDLYADESKQVVSPLRPIEKPDPGAFDGFIRGAGMYTMRGFAQAGRAIDIAGSPFAIAQDKLRGTGTEAQDRYFREHEEVFGSAVEHWTPSPGEVGVAAEVVGGLVSMIPLVIAAPELAVASAQLGSAEELIGKGVPADKAQMVGAIQGAGLGLGIWMPILGQSGWQRIALGGAGFNVVQGAAMRGASGAVLEGTAAGEDYKAFDGKALTLDVLTGLAFGTLAHLSPAQRSQGKAVWENFTKWLDNVDPSKVDAIVALRQSQHLNVDSTPGKLAGIEDIQAHADRVRTAIDQLAKDQQVAVDDLPAAKFEPDVRREQAAQRHVAELEKIAGRVRDEEGIPPVEPAHPVSHYLSPDQQVIERRFWHQLKDFQSATKAYAKLPESEGGKILNTDIARELSPDYNESNKTRSLNALAVHEPASDLVKKMYAERLKLPSESGENLVTFTAGGTGAGKTSAVKRVALASRTSEISDIVYDTNMNSFPSARGKIDQALEAGKRVAIMYVGRDPVDALVNGALPRAMEKGRTVPLNEHAKTHIGSAEVIQQLMEHYADQPTKVLFIFLDNSHGKGNAKVATPDLVKAYNFNDLDARLKEALDAEKEAGRISEDVYQGFSRDTALGAGQDLGEGRGRDAEQKREGGVQQGPVGRIVEKQLTNAGLPKEEVAANAHLWDSFFNAAAARYGVKPEELLAKYSPEFTRTTPEAMGETALAQGKRPIEDSGRVAPKPGETFIVYRVGSRPRLDGRNGGNAAGVAEHLARLDDFDSPQPAGGGAGRGGKIFAYKVTTPSKFGRYDTMNMERGEGVGTKVGRRNNDGAVAYSFPKGGEYEATLIGSIDVDAVRSELKKGGFSDFDDSGWLEGSKAIQRSFAKEKIFGQDERGAIRFDDGRTVIGLFETSDASTVVHESGHFFLEVTKDLATKADAPAQAMADWGVLAKWLKIEGGEIPRTAHEQFARGFEQFLMEGKAPTEELRGIFQQFKEWLVDIYKNVTQLGVDMNDDVRAVMGRMLGTKAEAPAATRGGEPTSSSSRSAAGGEPAGAKAQDPHFAEAQRIANERPDIRLPMGVDENGQTIFKSAREFLDDATAEAEKLREESKLISVAADCMEGV